MDRALNNVTKNSGDNVRLKCDFSGLPAPKIQWFKNEAPIEIEPGHIMQKLHRSYPDKVRARLLINKLTTHDTGYYRCEANNGYKTVESVGVLRVNAGMFPPL